MYFWVYLKARLFCKRLEKTICFKTTQNLVLFAVILKANEGKAFENYFVAKQSRINV
jgi:hypothetical protein